MYHYLAQHPDIFMSQRKEPRYFGSDLVLRDGFRITDEADYLALFRDGADATYRGEATVFYLYSQKAAEEIHAYSPQAKIIIMLREPIGMMLSSHNHYLASCNENLTDFEAAYKAQAERLQGHSVPKDAWYADALQYKKMVSYTQFIKNYYEVFGGTQNVHVVLFDDLKQDTAGVYKQVLEFLELDTSFQPKLEANNPAPPVSAKVLHRFWIRHPKIRTFLSRIISPQLRRNAMYLLLPLLPKGEGKSTITQEFRKELQQQLAPEVEQLGNLLGRDLSHWCQPADPTEAGDTP